MKRFLILILFCFSLNVSFAQTDSTTVEDGTEVSDTSVDKEFKTVEIEAQFPGGMPAWKKYLEKNLKVDLLEKCVKLRRGQKMVRQTVLVSFKVDRMGNISDVIAENASEVCPAIAAEAVRVIKNGPKWTPAVQDGRTVIYRQRQNITWVLTAD